ncbi:MAG: zeta toxin family protein [Bacteroidales bacterium]|nr:zeta toxin family protein [Bacteroidales bacterium]
MPKLYIISGCNGSGKTTASYTLLPDLLDCREFVNSDEFAKSFSPFDPGAASVTASRYMLMKINYLLEKRADFAVETTLATRSLLKIVQEAQRLGYETAVLYLWLNSPEIAIARVRDRVASGGHNIPDAVVRRRYVMGLQYLFDVYIPVMDRWVLADNSKPPFQVVAEGSREMTYIRDSEKYEMIWQIAHPDEGQ